MEKASAVEPQCMRHVAQHLGKFGDFGAAAAKFARHAGLDET